MPTSQASVATPMAGQFLFKLAKHFAKKVPVRQATEVAEVDFEFGHCRLAWQGGEAAPVLHFACDAPDAASLQRMQNVVESHLALMTRREPLEIKWTD